MRHINRTVVSGNVTKAPEYREVGEKKTPVVNIRIAQDDRRGQPHFFSIEAWNGQAKSCKPENLPVGTLISVDGRLAEDRWEDQKTGQKRSAVKIIADDISFLAFPNKSS